MENKRNHLSRKDLGHFRNLLLERRNEIIGDLTTMEDGELRPDFNELSHMPTHPADRGTDSADLDTIRSLAEGERSTLREIDEALERIEEGTYGVCEMTGKPIPKARLEAQPWARYTVEAARQLERGG